MSIQVTIKAVHKTIEIERRGKYYVFDALSFSDGDFKLIRGTLYQANENAGGQGIDADAEEQIDIDLDDAPGDVQAEFIETIRNER